MKGSGTVTFCRINELGDLVVSSIVINVLESVSWKEKNTVLAESTQSKHMQ